MAEPMKSDRDERPKSETDGYALASFVIGAVSLFSFDRLAFSTPSFGFGLVILLIPITGLLSAGKARQRIDGALDLRGRQGGLAGRQLALAGAILSMVSLVVMILVWIFDDSGVRIIG